MEWLKAILGNEELTVEQKQEAIQKELPKTFMPKNKYNEKIEELNSTVLKMDELNKQIETLSASSGEVETYKSELGKIKGEFDLFKTDSDKRVSTIQKKQAIEKGLIMAGANTETIDLLIGQFNMDNLQLDQSGNIVDWGTHLNPLIESRKSLFATTQLTGDKPQSGTQPTLNTYQNRYTEAMKTGNRREAIKIKQEAFREGEII